MDLREPTGVDVLCSFFTPTSFLCKGLFSSFTYFSIYQSRFFLSFGEELKGEENNLSLKRVIFSRIQTDDSCSDPHCQDSNREVSTAWHHHWLTLRLVKLAEQCLGFERLPLIAFRTESCSGRTEQLIVSVCKFCWQNTENRVVPSSLSLRWTIRNCMY